MRQAQEGWATPRPLFPSSPRMPCVYPRHTNRRIATPPYHTRRHAFSPCRDFPIALTWTNHPSNARPAIKWTIVPPRVSTQSSAFAMASSTVSSLFRVASCRLSKLAPPWLSSTASRVVHFPAKPPPHQRPHTWWPPPRRTVVPACWWRPDPNSSHMSVVRYPYRLLQHPRGQGPHCKVPTFPRGLNANRGYICEKNPDRGPRCK
jgi:hypothetical protein